MKTLKRYVLGFASGSLYALINYILLTSLMRNNPVGIILWGVQGVVFLLCWDLSNLFSIKRTKHSYFFSAINGGVSGLGASILSIMITFLGYRADNIKDSAMWSSLYVETFQYAVGCIFLGVIIGLILHGVEKKGTKNQSQSIGDRPEWR